MLGHDVARALSRCGKEFAGTCRDVDISRYAELEAFARDSDFRVIINCAAYTAVEKAEQEARKAFQVNSLGVENIALIARKIDATVIHVSTDYVFDGLKGSPYIEEDVPNPINTYGRTKAKGEELLQATWHKYFIVRTSWLYGPHGGNFVLTMLDLFSRRQEVSVVDDQWGNPTYTSDLADFILYLVITGKADYGIYHFSNKGCVTWFDFACQIHAAACKYGLVSRKVRIIPVSTREYGSKVKRPAYTCLSKDKVENSLGYRVGKWQDALDGFFSRICHGRASKITGGFEPDV